MKRSSILLVGALLLLMAAMGLKGRLLELPPVRGEAAQGQFDTQRALARLQRILGDERPHPVDSVASDGVRTRLIAEMRAAGLEPRMADHFACNSGSRGRGVNCARIRNLVATIGPAQGRHVLVVSHYDSATASPGASDDGIGVAAMLETAELLRGRSLQRPVTFLFNEGEESGLIGARAFLARDPLAGRIETLVNLESRGVEGPALMFETSRPNGPAVTAFARAVDRPFANSLTTDFYRMIPNSTDVAVFEEGDWTILNFAIIGNETRYHSPGDTLAALDPRSVQHMGDQAYAVVTQLATGEAPAAGGEKLYTDILGRGLVVLPALAGPVMLGLLIIGMAFVGWRRGGLGRGALTVLAAMLGATAIAWLGQWLMGLAREGDYWRAYPAVTGMAVYLSALLACGAALLWIGRSLSAEKLRTAFWLVVLVNGAGISVAAPGAAILFLLPPSVALIGMLASRWTPVAERIAAILAAILLYLTHAPLLDLLETLLSHGGAWMFAPLAASILMAALIELRPLTDDAKPRRLIGGLAAAALAGWAAVAMTPAYSENRQQLFGIEYLWDENEAKSRWLVNNDGPALPEGFDAFGPWEARTNVPHTTRRRWSAAGPAMPLRAPTLQLVSQAPVEGGRRLTMRIASNGAETMGLRAPAEARLRGAGTPGFMRPFGNGTAEDPWFFRCVGRSCDGLVFDIVVEGREPIEWTVIGTRIGLPAQARPLLEARPDHARPQYAPDATIATARLRL